jgi:uncharacterized membrane protein
VSATYNRFAGQSVERLAALSDGVFAVAMTLLVLDIGISASSVSEPHTDEALLRALSSILPNIAAYLLSFMTMGIFWVGQQTQLNHFERSDRNLSWIHLGFLLAVTLMPFSTRLLSEFNDTHVAVIIYWLNILLMGLMLFASWRYARRAGLTKDSVDDEMSAATERRIFVAQSLYAFGALLSLFNTYLGIGFILLVQLNYVLAPRIRPLYRL